MSRSTDGTDCDRVLDLLEPFVDDEVDATERVMVRNHVERCPTCAQELSLARRIRRGLRAMPQPELPPRLADDLPEVPGAILARTSPPTPSRRWAVVGSLAAVLVAAMLVLWASSPFDSSPQVVRQPAPSAEEIERAEAEARYALAQVAAVSRRAGLELRDEIFGPHLVQPMTRNLTESLRTVPNSNSTGDDA